MNTRKNILARLAADEYEFTELMSATFAVTSRVRNRVFLDRMDERNEHGDALPSEYSVRFQSGDSPSDDLIHPQQIPALIDALTLMHRQWLLDLNDPDEPRSVAR